MNYHSAKEKAIKDYLTQLLTTYKGNVYRCAKVAEMDRGNFMRLLKKYNLKQADYRPAAVV